MVNFQEFRFFMLLISFLSTLGLCYLIALIRTSVFKNAICKCNNDNKSTECHAFCHSCGKFKGHINERK